MLNSGLTEIVVLNEASYYTFMCINLNYIYQEASYIF